MNETKINKVGSIITDKTNDTYTNTNTNTYTNTYTNTNYNINNNIDTEKYNKTNVIRNPEPVKINIHKRTLPEYISSFFKKFKISDIKNCTSTKEKSIKEKSIKEINIKEKSTKEKSIKEICRRIIMVDSINDIESNKSSFNSKNNSLKYDFTNLLKDNNIKCKNMNNELKNIMKNYINNSENNNNNNNNLFDLVDDWSKPPEKHGLENSDRIFGAYYLTNKNLNGKIFEIDFLYTILDDIRNYRKLSKYQLSYIKDLDSETKSMIINEFNEVLDVIINSYN